MRWFAVAAVLLGSLLWAAPARAQFQNHSIGLSVGYLHLQNDIGFKDALLPPAFALDGTLYIEAGFDIGLRFGLAIQEDQLGSQTIIIYPAAEFRYFLWQDYFRPFVGANLEFVHAFDGSTDAAGISSGTPSDNYVGLGPVLGFDYFFNEEWSVGLSGEFAGYFALNAGAHYSVQLWGRVATHF